TNLISDFHHGHAGTTRDWRSNCAIANLDFQIFHLRGVRLNGGPPDIDLGSRVLKRDQSSGALADELGVARYIALSLLQVGLCARQEPFHLPRLRFECAAVQGKEQVALLDSRAVAEMHPDDFAIHPRLDSDAGNRSNRPKHLDLNR